MGNYEVLAQIGQGGMGGVFRARDKSKELFQVTNDGQLMAAEVAPPQWNAPSRPLAEAV
jgi:hypothetical protein